MCPVPPYQLHVEPGVFGWMVLAVFTVFVGLEVYTFWRYR